MPHLYEQIKSGKIDPTKIITHKMSLDEAAHGYNIFNKKEDDCIKVILKP